MQAPLVLLVEDEPLVLLVAQDALEAGGYKVVPVQLACEALEVLRGRCAQLSGLVTDIRLPDGPDGLEIARQARELRPDLPVVYTTADSWADWPEKGVPNGGTVAHGRFCIDDPSRHEQIELAASAYRTCDRLSHVNFSAAHA